MRKYKELHSISGTLRRAVEKLIIYTFRKKKTEILVSHYVITVQAYQNVANAKLRNVTENS